MMKDKAARTVAVYFDTVEDKEKFERQAKRFGVPMGKLIKMSMAVGLPVVLRSLRSMKRQQNQAVKAVSEQ